MSLTTVRQAQMLPTNCSSQMVNLRLARATSPEVSCCVLAISGKLKRPACTVEPVNNKNNFETLNEKKVDIIKTV